MVRNKAVGRRVGIQNQRQYHADQRKHVLQVLQEFQTLCTTFVASVDRSTASPDVATLRDGLKRVHEAHELLEDIDQDLQREETRVSALDDDLRRLEKNFYDQLDTSRGFGHNELPASVSDGSHDDLQGDTSFSSHSGSSSADTLGPVIVRDYYDKIGDVNILRERLFNFESEHQRQVKIRELRKAARKPVKLSDAPFYRMYFKERKILVREYSKSKESVASLMIQCRHEGHDVEEMNIAPFAERDALDRSFQISRFQSSVSASRRWTGSDFQITPMQKLESFSRAESKLRIFEWLDSTPMPDSSWRMGDDDFVAEMIFPEYESSCWIADGQGTEAEQDQLPDETIETSPSSYYYMAPHDQFQPEIISRRYSNPSMQIRNELRRERNQHLFPSSRNTT